MTKEELKQEAEEYANTNGTTVMGFEENLDCTDFVIKAYLASAEPREKRITELEAQIEKMKKYIKACWIEENLNDYSSYITNNSDEFRDLVKEINDEVRNGR